MKLTTSKVKKFGNKYRVSIYRNYKYCGGATVSNKREAYRMAKRAAKNYHRWY